MIQTQKESRISKGLTESLTDEGGTDLVTILITTSWSSAMTCSFILIYLLQYNFTSILFLKFLPCSVWEDVADIWSSNIWPPDD